MAGVNFTFDNLKQLLRLNIGMSQRVDENRSESFTLLYCDFGDIDNVTIDNSLEQVLRNSDSIVSHGKDYFFVLQSTDKYGADIVKKMFDDFFAKKINFYAVSYPVDGETPTALLSELQDGVSRVYSYDLVCLD